VLDIDPNVTAAFAHICVKSVGPTRTKPATSANVVTAKLLYLIGRVLCRTAYRRAHTVALALGASTK
jgi:hypothetical protein